MDRPGLATVLLPAHGAGDGLVTVVRDLAVAIGSRWARASGTPGLTLRRWGPGPDGQPGHPLGNRYRRGDRRDHHPPQGRANVAMVWQAEADLRFKMPGGYFVGSGPDGGTRHDAPPTTTSGILNRIRLGHKPPELTPALRRKIAADFANWRVSSVVLGPTTHGEAMAGFLTDLLGRPPASTGGGVALWPDATVAPAGRRSGA
jgi:hypothetical protein